MNERPRAPRVDVVISYYNKPGTIERAVGSVLSQTLADWRLIVVDDGSEIPLRLPIRDSRIRVARQANGGPGAARNAGAAKGQAPYIAFLDADDEWEPSYLELAIEALERNLEVGAVSSSWFFGDDRVDQTAMHERTGVSGRFIMSPSIAPAQFKAWVDSLHSSATVVRRNTFERLGGFFEEGTTFGEDSWLWARVLLSQPVLHVSRPLIHFHTDASALSHGRATPYPIPPLLLNFARVYSETSEDLHGFLAEYAAYYADDVLHRLVSQGQRRQATAFLRSREYRALRSPWQETLRLRLRLRAWPLYRRLRRL